MASKPSVPAGYVKPKIWTPKIVDGPMGALNLPTAGARTTKVLPRGDHELQLYSLATPNGQKVSILLEELNEATGLEYDAWMVMIMGQDQFSSGFVEINPNSKIPALADHSMSPPLRVFESGNILKYLAEKYDRFIPKDIRAQTECFNWLFWLQGSAPYIGGGFGHFYKYAPINFEYAIDRFTMEVKRLFDVLNQHLRGKQFICGDEYSIADVAIFPWFHYLSDDAVGYGGSEFLAAASYTHVQEWITRVAGRPAVQRGMRVNGYGSNAVPERHSRADFEPKAKL